MRDAHGRALPAVKRHFQINDEGSVRTALSQAPQSPFGKPAMPAIIGAARKYGVRVSAEARAFAGMEPRHVRFP